MDGGKNEHMAFVDKPLGVILPQRGLRRNVIQATYVIQNLFVGMFKEKQKES